MFGGASGQERGRETDVYPMTSPVFIICEFQFLPNAHSHPTGGTVIPIPTLIVSEEANTQKLSAPRHTAYVHIETQRLKWYCIAYLPIGSHSCSTIF